MNDEHRQTKNMLNLIREGGLTRGKLLNEIDNSQQPNSANNVDGAIQPSSADVKAEQNKFMQIVGPRVEFTAFNIYPNDNNVVLAGKFDNGLDWQFSKKDGLYINADNIKIDSDMSEQLRKLYVYYDNWSDEWASRLQSEFKSNTNNG